MKKGIWLKFNFGMVETIMLHLLCYVSYFDFFYNLLEYNHMRVIVPIHSTYCTKQLIEINKDHLGKEERDHGRGIIIIIMPF